MAEILSLNIQSEIGELEGVILHTPGAEVENMTPGTAQRALYSDILNLSIAKNEYDQLQGVLGKYTRTFQVTDLLEQVLANYSQREMLIKKVCESEGALEYYEQLMAMQSAELAKALIEGVPARKNTLTAFLSDEYYALYPLYNFYFTMEHNSISKLSMLMYLLIVFCCGAFGSAIYDLFKFIFGLFK